MGDNHYDQFLLDVGNTVRTIRKEHGLSMESVAMEAGIEYRQLGRIERGEVNPTVISLLKIAEAMGVEVHQFLVPPESKK